MSNEKLLLTAAQAAELLGVARGFLYQNRHGRHSKTVPFVMLGGSVRYRRQDIEAFLADNVQTTPNATPPSIAANKAGSPKKGGRPTKKESLQKAGLLP